MVDSNATVLHKMSQMFDEADQGTQVVVRWWEWFHDGGSAYAIIGLVATVLLCLWCCCPKCCWCCGLPCRLCCPSASGSRVRYRRQYDADDDAC